MINKIIIKKAYKIYPHYYIILFTQSDSVYRVGGLVSYRPKILQTLLLHQLGDALLLT